MLQAIGPLDGRYRAQLEGLERFVSEAALIHYRLRIEAAWLLELESEPAVARHLQLPPAAKALLRQWAERPPEEAAAAVKEVERTTNHDVKAVEYVLRDGLERAGAGRAALAFVHFACTSEDINNLSYAMMLKELRSERLLPLMDRLLLDLADKARQHAALPMLSRTHGQTATPTTLGKELGVFGHRLRKLRVAFAALPLDGKINGAVGNYNAHLAAFPEVDWPRLAQRFVEDRLGLTLNALTTQIENHDAMVAYARAVEHFNTVAIGLCRDLWGYVSLGYFRQKTIAGEVGSSTMPHKVNPIDFENAEGNLGVANALAVHFAQKLPISRWQRDLSDSTVQRTLGTMVGHTELAWRSLLKGLGKLEVNPARLAADLDDAWEVLAEAVQTVMRRYGVADAYERLKEATRGKATVTRQDLLTLVESCAELPSEAKEALRKLTPQTYVGLAKELALEFADA
jgi:adenylosuccinate lyase